MIEAVAWAGGITGTAWAIGSTIKAFYAKPVCNLHGPLMSDIASIKHGIMLITAFITEEAGQKGIDLNEKMINLMMKK